MYEPQAIETKWQRRWAETNAFAAPERPDPARKYYVLEMFPYPSGNLHMGHVRNYAIGDLIARFQWMRGNQVLHPMGWDALGLPAERAAVKDGIHPSVRTESNIANVKRQFLRLGIAYDWSREIGTHRPAYYRWNQWFFLKFLEKGLVYRRTSEVNWCPNDQTVLANEQVIEGRCWRCETVVVKKAMPEWAFRITAYAQQLLDGIEELVRGGWPERVTTMQRNWIGKSVGLECEFPVAGSAEKIPIFTTRADTIHGATYVVLAPEHPRVETITAESRRPEVRAFVERMRRTDKIARTAADTTKEGVDTGARAVNPFTGETIPVWLANFVLADYGTGAVMSVPAHDQRDFEFAKKYGLPIREVVAPSARSGAAGLEAAFTEDGVLVASGAFTGMESAKAREAIAAKAQGEGFGKATVKWHLRDWGFSRQRYWGTPIPIVYCEGCGAVPVPEKDLPIVLPTDAPLTGEGAAPLAKVESFVKTTCPTCGGPARREVETMDTFVDSTWYFARFLDPRNDRAPFRRDLADAWLPVDIYIGGPEHAVLHLLYFRFWTMVMKELGLVADGEPVRRLLTQGIVYKDGAKMSKSKGNVVSPDEMVEKYGADTARLFSLFAAPPEKDLEWDDQSVVGCFKFLKRAHALVERSFARVSGAPALDPAVLAKEAPACHAAWRETHALVEHATGGIGERFHYNTPVAKMMGLINTLSDLPEKELETPQGRSALRFSLETLSRVLAPYAPHLAEEMWEMLGHDGGIVKAGWPSHDPAALKAETFTMAVQVNGKVRGEVTLPVGADEATARAAALGDAKVKPWVADKKVVRVVYVPGKILNLVVA